MLLVFANKQDVSEAVSVEDVKNLMKLSEVKIPWYIQGCSSELGDGLYEGLEWLANALKNKNSKPYIFLLLLNFFINLVYIHSLEIAQNVTRNAVMSFILVAMNKMHYSKQVGNQF